MSTINTLKGNDNDDQSSFLIDNENRSKEMIVPSALDDVPVYKIVGEEGVFPTGKKDEDLVLCSSAKIYQLNAYTMKPSSEGKDIVEGTLILRDPSPGTPDEVALVGECEEVLFYLKNDDLTVKISDNEFILFLPEECFGMSFGDEVEQDIKLHIEGLLAYRTIFKDDSENASENALVAPQDKVSKSMIKMSTWLADGIVSVSEKGARKIEKYGDSKRSTITETKEKKISTTAMKTSKATRNAAKKTNEVVSNVTDGISKKVGSIIAKAVTPKNTDSNRTKKGRSILMASTVSACEIMGGVTEGYKRLTETLKDESTMFVEAKYGKDAGQFARNTVGATFYVGNAILTTRRVVSVKSIAKSSAKQAAKQTVKNMNSST